MNQPKRIGFQEVAEAVQLEPGAILATLVGCRDARGSGFLVVSD
jgi:hypothetical protein